MLRTIFCFLFHHEHLYLDIIVHRLKVHRFEAVLIPKAFKMFKALYIIKYMFECFLILKFRQLTNDLSE